MRKELWISRDLEPHTDAFIIVWNAEPKHISKMEGFVNWCVLKPGAAGTAIRVSAISEVAPEFVIEMGTKRKITITGEEPNDTYTP